MTKTVGSESESVPTSHKYESADSDPDPHHNAMDPQHC